MLKLLLKVTVEMNKLFNSSGAKKIFLINTRTNYIIVKSVIDFFNSLTFIMHFCFIICIQLQLIYICLKFKIV